MLGSRKLAAKRFKRWVTHDVLPAIHRRGRYIAPGAEQQPEDFAAHGQASRRVDHGRVVAAISRTVQAFDRLPAERVDLVNSIATRITGIDTLDLLESEGWQRPAPQASGADPHPWDAQIEDWLAGQEADGGWTTDHILIEALSYPAEAIGISERTRLGYCLRRLGLTKRRPNEGTTRVYRWYRRVH